MPKREVEKLEMLRLSNVESNRITKECIQTALILLLENQEFDEITITNLVKKAGVSRTAYYRNYNSKEDVLYELLNELVKQSIDAIESSNGSLEKCLTLFEKTMDNADTFILLHKAHFGDIMLTKITESLVAQVPETLKYEKMRQIALSGAIYNILRLWILNGMNETSVEMAEQYAKVVCHLLVPINE